MSEVAKQDTNVVAVVDARLSNARLLRETVESLESGVSANPRPVQVRTETSTKFAVGLDDASKPKSMTVEIEYKVTHSMHESNQKIVEYSAAHMALFEIMSFVGINSWMKPPTSAMAPYFAMVHGMAMRRAEHTFLDMGLRGVALPRITDYSAPIAEPAVFASDKRV